MTYRRKASFKSRHYVELMGYTCANPNCKSGSNVQGHHITPLSQGGFDAYWNLIALCTHCHRGNGHHSEYHLHKAELNVWKCTHELNRFGFYLDEQEPDFKTNFRNAIRILNK